MPTFTHSPIADLGDKVVSDINAVQWIPPGVGAQALPFTAKRVYFVQDYQPDDINLHVDVLCAEIGDEELADRANISDRQFVVAIGIQQVLQDRTNLAATDILMGFANAVLTFYALESQIAITGSQFARCVKREMPVIYSPEELDKNSRFFSVIHLTFEGWYVGG